MPGPPKTPTAILEKRNSWRAKVRHNEPETIGLPEPPEWLDGDALAHWDRCVQRLVNMNIAGEADADKLAIYCVTYIKFRDVCRNNDDPKQLDKMVKAAQLIDRLGSQFGFSPSARANMAIEMPKKDVEKKKFFRDRE